MKVLELHDREAIAAFLRRNPLRHVYELGDLDDFFWPHTRWFGAVERHRLRQVALVYDEPAVPVLLALAEEPQDTMARLVEELLPSLPHEVYAHLSPVLLETAQKRFGVSHHEPHLKMGLTRPERLGQGDGTPDAELLGPDDVAEVEAFYEHAYPGTWFAPRMLGSERYVGVRRDGRLMCVAGVHVYSPTWRAAALGNVATAPESRGQGLARAACRILCRALLDDGIDAVALNVRADNAPAIAVYRALGFEPVAEYVEARLSARP